MTKWPSDQTEWPSDQVTKWPSDQVTEWLSDQVTKWQEASQTIDRMVYFVYNVSACAYIDTFDSYIDAWLPCVVVCVALCDAVTVPVSRVPASYAATT